MKKLPSLLVILFLPVLLFVQETIDPDIAQILSDQGKYDVEAERGNQSGHFNLQLKKIGGKRLVTVDHPS